MNININRLVGKKIADRYCITGEIGVGGMGRVFRAMPFDDPSHDVAIKVILRNRQLNSEDLLRFQKEAALMSRLHHPNIICFHELGLLQDDSSEGGEFGSGYYIVMEIANGSNLKDSLARDGRKDLAFFFQVGLQVTAALDYTHGKNIIHRDIKPQNIVVGKAAQEQRDLTVKVLDFGVARLAEAMHFTASAESPNNKAFQDIAGTPLYMAPEQTHLMDAPIDHRVDLYSLGCVLYEILVGRPPFSANTREKLERQHVYSTPEPLTSLRPDVPPIIEQIIHKLLSKHPDERYQTAFALHTDLLRARRRLERRDRPSAIAFPLGLNDRFQSVSANLKLVGRDSELQLLIEGYNATSQEKGRSRLSVVQGPAGTGKTKLLSEFRNYLLKRKIRFISANFSQHENALPFNALANGFNDYLIRVLKSQPHEAEELRRKVKTLLGPTAYQVAAVVPGLKTFIPDEIEAPEVSSAEDFQTFAKAFSDFTRCLAVDSQPVVFIFDDLHWADEKSLELIDQFFSHNNSQRFFMIISHRPNDPMASPRFKLFLEKFRKLRRRYEEIELGGFSRGTVKAMVQNMLGTHAEDALGDDLVDFLSETAQGNPIRLVELVRQLVARDLIFLTSNKSAEWQYNMEAILKAELNLNTVDLALSKIQEFQGFDKLVLETSATIGLSFPYELLLLDGQKDSVRVMQTLQRALDEGVITRVADEPELKVLGKSYSFTHWRARDAIYKNIDSVRLRTLHEAIAKKLEESGVTETPKGIFALAHHYNYSLSQHKASSSEIASKCIKANIIAGKTAKASGSWQSAERYFDNAYQQMLQWPEAVIVNDSRIQIIENLADLAALQRRHGDALKKYSELTNYPISEQTWASVVYKTAYLQISSGIISQSIQSIKSYLLRLRLRIPQDRLKEYWGFTCAILWDAWLPVGIKAHRLFKLLKSAAAHAQKSSNQDETRFVGSKLYSLAQMVFMVEKPKLALLFHHVNLSETLKHHASLSQTIRVVADRAAILGYFGFFKIAYQLMDLAMDLCRSTKDKTTFGYLSLLRCLFVDFLKDKEEEINDHLKSALRFISPESERIWYGLALEFRMYRELMKGNVKAVINYSRIVPDTIPTRNWLSPRAMAITFYAYLLNDARDIIVHGGELYVKRRLRVSGRTSDLFVSIINTIVTFAKGETDKTRKYYTAVVQDFLRPTSEQFLFPFEEDFVALFAYTFPLFFEQEHGRRLMRDNELRTIFVSLQKRVAAIKGQNRGVACMLRARARELLGKRDVKSLYDAALHSAKLCGNQLPLILTHLWFGNLLIKLGATKRSEYLKKAHAAANQLQLFALVEYSEKLMERRGISFRPTTVKEAQREKASKFGSYRSNLIFEHIEHLSEVLQLDTALEQNIEESIAVLRRQYGCKRVVCLLTKGEHKKPYVIYPYEVKNESTFINYLEPYFNVRSTLFLPTNDAPWVTPSDIGSTDPNVLTFPGGNTRIETVNPAMDETIVLDTSPPSLHTQPRLVAQTAKPSGAATLANTSTGAEARQKNLLMSALVPLRTQSGNRGLLFLEDVDLSNKETALCRNELDIFGAQLGLLVNRKLMQVMDLTLSLGPEESGVDLQNFTYKSGDYSLEKVKWLNLWSHGQLREKRETAWYLGLNLSVGHYLLMYCRFNGGPNEREKVSRVIWNHMLVVRALALASGKSNFDSNEFRDDIGAALGYLNAAKELEAISISYTIFDRENRTATSGHFGPSRPLVLSTENQVTPLNQVILSLNNGRDVRYWSVNADLHGIHLYVLAHDSSKLDVNLNDSQKRSLRTSLMESGKAASVHRAFEKLILKDNIPRYYVGAVMLDDNELAVDSMPKYDKAE